MSEQTYSVLGSQLTGIADAIRGKSGGSGELAFPTGFTSGIGEITTLAEGTADATATAADIKQYKTAYVNGVKVTGSYNPTVTLTENTQASINRTLISGRTFSTGDVIFTEAIPSNIIPDTTQTIYGTIQGMSGDLVSAEFVTVNGELSVRATAKTSFKVSAGAAYRPCVVFYTAKVKATVT